MANVTGERITLGLNQFLLMQDAIEGLLKLVVENPDEDVPVGKDPWEGAGILGKTKGTGEVWSAINQGRAVLSASRRWRAE